MEKPKALFGEAESIVEQTRNPRLIAKRIRSNELKANKQTSKTTKKQMNLPSKKPNSFGK